MSKKKYFNHIAENWEIEHSHDTEIKKTEELIKSFNISKNGRILDVGCGSGRLIPYIKKAIGEDGLLIELDFSEKMLKIGKEKFNFRNLHFIQTNAELIGLKDKTFTTIICLALFPHLNNKLLAMKEFHRLLQPKGSLIITHQMSRHQLNNFHQQLNGPVNKDRLPENSKMKKFFISAGFSELEIIDKPDIYIARGKS